MKLKRLSAFLVLAGLLPLNGCNEPESTSIPVAESTSSSKYTNLIYVCSSYNDAEFSYYTASDSSYGDRDSLSQLRFSYTKSITAFYQELTLTEPEAVLTDDLITLFTTEDSGIPDFVYIKYIGRSSDASYPYSYVIADSDLLWDIDYIYYGKWVDVPFPFVYIEGYEFSSTVIKSDTSYPFDLSLAGLESFYTSMEVPFDMGDDYIEPVFSVTYNVSNVKTGGQDEYSAQVKLKETLSEIDGQGYVTITDITE